ncbi:hypothetical protein E2C01_033433 [Portunus trituberculatus]|uniref:Uncharacterized protein n=1 Tax=Portunus trituberculatus TaxID=210409 RepID=A0A5B7EXU8_PORTR|nr:hypothetical protein [Portunus trituberculatus]
MAGCSMAGCSKAGCSKAGCSRAAAAAAVLRWQGVVAAGVALRGPGRPHTGSTKAITDISRPLQRRIRPSLSAPEQCAGPHRLPCPRHPQEPLPGVAAVVAAAAMTQHNPRQHEPPGVVGVALLPPPPP